MKIRISLFPADLFAAIAVSLVIFIIRYENVAGLVLPLWVDSVHHSALARLILAQGGLPFSLRPYADVDTVYYHLGYHATIAIITLLTGWQVEHVMLVFGQLLNVLACISLYLLAVYWTARPVAGLTALVVSGTLSLMPAYYVTWGRYTQLMGLVILPVAILFISDYIATGRRSMMLAGGVTTGVLVYVHYRVTFFLCTFVFAYLMCFSLYMLRQHQPLRTLWQRFVTCFGIAFLVSAPWLWRIATTFIFPLDSFLPRITGAGDYNAVPWDLVARDLTPQLYGVAAIGIVLGLRARRMYVAVILLWCLLTVVAVNPNLIGLSPSWIVNNFSVVIAQYVPLSLLAAVAVSELVSIAEKYFLSAYRGWITVAVSVILVVAALVGSANMVNIVNPVTVLATRPDVSAFDWIRAYTPEDSIFLINERLWQGNIYVGTDGGYWIPNLTGRQTTMPIVFYTEGTPPYVEQVNALARVVEAGPNPDAPDFLTLLRKRGVTYVYIGVKGGSLPLQAFQSSPNFTLVYSVAGAYIFKLNAAPSHS